MGWVALIKVLGGDVKKQGLISEQVGHRLQTSFTSLVEKGRFFERTNCNNLVTPGQHNSLGISIKKSILPVDKDPQCALDNAFDATFSFPGQWRIVYEKDASSKRHPRTLLFFTLVRLLLSNTKATDR